MATATWAGFSFTPRGLCSVFLAVFVDSGSVMCMAGIAGIFLFALCSLLLSSGPRCLSSWPVWIEGQFCSWFRSVCSEFPSVVVGPKMLVGMDQKESYAARSSPRSSPTSHFLCWFYWLRYTLCCVPLFVGSPVMTGIMQFLVWPRLSSTTAVVCSMLVLLVTIHLVLCSLVCRQPCDDRHHVWLVVKVQNTAEVPLLQFIAES